jgi:hypothetical protein
MSICHFLGLHVGDVIMHAWVMSLVSFWEIGTWLMHILCSWCETYLWYNLWYMVDVHGMVQVLVHNWCTSYGTCFSTCLMDMVWYMLWYMVDVHGMLMVLVSKWVDVVIVGWWWYIGDSDNDSDGDRDIDRLDDWLIINDRLMW